MAAGWMTGNVGHGTTGIFIAIIGWAFYFGVRVTTGMYDFSSALNSIGLNMILFSSETIHHLWTLRLDVLCCVLLTA